MSARIRVRPPNPDQPANAIGAASGAWPAARLAKEYQRVRAATEALIGPLNAEDCQVQSFADASPAKWHLGHVTWFFETFVLERFEPRFGAFDASFRVLFNSYYQGVGEQHPRPLRGLLTHPALCEVLRYRARVDERIQALLVRKTTSEMRDLVVRNAPVDEIRKLAIDQGMVPLREQALRLVADDVTTIAEVMRTIYIL